MDKVVWDDSGTIKALKGTIVENKEGFVKIKMPDGTIFHINKEQIKSIREDSEDVL